MEDGRLTPLSATSGAPGANRLLTSHPEQINPPHSKLRATWGSLGQLHPIALPPPTHTPPPPNQAGSGSEEARRGLEKEEALSSSPQAPARVQREPYLRRGPGLARSRSFSLSPLSGSSRMAPPSGCPKPRPGHAPKSRPRLWRGPLGREPNHKQNLQRPTRGGGGGRARRTRRGCTVGNTRCGGAYRGRGIRRG